MKLKASQVEYIHEDLLKRGLVYEPFREEILDHVCAMLEEKLEGGEKFQDAYANVLKSFGPDHELNRIQYNTLITTHSIIKTMLATYFKTAIRNIKRRKFYTFINTAGLSIGIACTLLISLFIADELGYDRHNLNGERIYRVISHIRFGGNDTWYAVCPAPMARAISEEIPEIEKAGRFRLWGSILVKKGEENIEEYNIAWTDPEILRIFTIPLIHGNQDMALAEPNTAVISESTARKYFGEQDPLNQILTLNNDMNYKVAGVYKDFPDKSHFHFNMMLAISGLEESKNDMWLSNNFQTYFLIKQGADPKAAEKKINDLLLKYAEPQVMQFLGKTIAQLEAEDTKVEQRIQPLYDIHLRSSLIAEIEPNGDIRYVYIFSTVALFILILAVINFINLTTARSADRAREVGIRKVMGSYRKHLVFQFLAESVFICLIAVIIAILLANLIVPLFNQLAEKSISIPNGSIAFWILILAAGLVVGIMAGIYPAFFLSSFKPVSILSGKFSRGARNPLMRNFMVVLQFTISTVLIIWTLAVYNQLNYIMHFRLGYNKDQVIIVESPYILGNQVESFKNEVLKNPVIKSGTISGFLPIARSDRNNTTFWKKGDRSPENFVNMQSWTVDHDYIGTLGMKIVAGRDFSRDYPSDSSAIILNERAARLFGFENPIGQEIVVFRSSPDNSIDEMNDETLHIIGIVQDFNWESLHENIGSLSLRLGSSPGRISFRYNGSETATVIDYLDKKWDEYKASLPFEFSFLDQDFASMYSSESRTANIFSAFVILAIVIACLGLFALAAFMAEQRTKEIGVRKVMGATIGNIVLMLSGDFTKLVFLAYLISIPIAWYGIRLWLQGFAYKDIPGILLYGGAGLGAIVIAWITVSYQSFRAASTNPAEALRDE
ncbi:MAG TPA: ABC transporter permease [Cyclobacteriaceae bacterium]|nr:ABC transporter permease [Cyclobacteriaceae bacterium]